MTEDQFKQHELDTRKVFKSFSELCTNTLHTNYIPHELFKYEEQTKTKNPNACNRICLTYNHKYMFVNNRENNIDVYQVPHNKWFSEPDKKRVAFIDIEGKGMLSSCAIKGKVLIGCRDGTCFEIDSD
jgi:hypothetical protein